MLKRLVEFAEGEKAILWGRGASVGSFQFMFADQDGTRRPAFFVLANGRMSFDFGTLSKRLDPKVIASYRGDLARTEDIPREAITTDTWKEFDVTALSSQRSWKAFKQAVLAIRKAVRNLPHDH